nr:ribonuclease H-like domain-containing protein [Tanacetum cinerariifolium]
MVSSVKLPILKKGEYILWTMKTEQCLAHTDYALWEVILNGNSAVQMSKDKAGNKIKVPPITAHQILAGTRERKAKSTLLMAIPDEHLARFHGIKDAKTLWDAIKTRFGGNVESKKMQKNNVAFVSTKSTISTNELNAAYSVSTATCHSSQAQGLEQIDQDDLQEMDLKWQVAMLSMRVKRFYKKTSRKLEFNRKDPVGFDKNKVECFNFHKRGHLARDFRSARNSGNMSRDAGNAGYRGRDNGKRPAKEKDAQALVVQDGLGLRKVWHTMQFLLLFTGNYMPPKPDLSFPRLDDSINKFKISETVTSLAKDEKDASETSTAFVKKPKEDRSSAPLIEDWETDSDDDNVFTHKLILAKIDFVKAVFTRSGRIPVSAAKPKAVTSTSAAKLVNTAGPKQSVNFSRTTISAVKGNGVTVVKTSAGCVWRLRGHPQQALKNKGIVDSGCSRHMTWNKAYLVDYQEIHDGGFVAFSSSRGKIKVSAGNQTNKNVGLKDTNGNAGTQDNVDAGKEVSDQQYIMFPLWSSISSTYKNSDDKPYKPKDDTGSKTIEEPVNKED